MKGMVLPGTLFEEMGFNYIGPIDGHDIEHAGARRCATCANCKGPQFLHVVTRKGKGYAPAEADPINWHGPGPVRSGQRHDLQGKGHRPDLLAGVRRLAVRHGRAPIRGSSASRRRCAKARAWWSSRSAFPTATSTSRSPSSTR